MRRVCWNPCRTECRFLLKLRFITRRKIFTPVTLNGGRRTATRKYLGAQWSRWTRSSLRIASPWWRRSCLSSTSNSAWSRSQPCITCARSARSWRRRALPSTVTLIVHPMATILWTIPCRRHPWHLPPRAHRAVTSKILVFQCRRNSSLSCWMRFISQCLMSSHQPPFKRSMTFIIEPVMNFTPMWY